MDAPNVWKEYFRHWPTDMEQRGVLVTSYEEQIPFDGFAISENLLLVDRKNPDPSGARKIVIPYGQILALKIVDVVKMKSFATLGFIEVAHPKKQGG